MKKKHQSKKCRVGGKIVRVGDVVHYNYKRHVVREIRRGEITSLSADGMVVGGSKLDQRCFQSEMFVIYASERCRYWDTRISNEAVAGLNLPDIFRWMERKWHSACSFEADGNRKRAAECLSEIEKFGRDITAYNRRLKMLSCHGFWLLRPKMA